MRDLIKVRRGTRAEWESKNPVLSAGEPGAEIGTGKLKIGDGSTRWNSLPYTGSTSAAVDLQEHIDDETPHPAYDDIQSLVLLYENAKV